MSNVNSFPFLSANARHGLGAPWDQVLLETEHFVVVPSVGALVPGWLLIVPRRSVLAVGALDDESVSELDGIKQVLFQLLRREFGSACAFEHGPSARGQSVGCSVDHAHLHVVPAPCHLIDASVNFVNGCLKWEPASGLLSTMERFRMGRSYLYVEQADELPQIADAEAAPSQLFRRAIARHLGITDQYDWRLNPMTENVLATVACLRRWL